MGSLVVLLLRLLGRGLPAVALAGFLGAAAFAEAAIISVGNGSNEASVQIEFADGASYTFEVAFDGVVTGLGLVDIIEANTPLTTVRVDYGWGLLVDGFACDGHSNAGFLGGEDWWHYWVKSPGGDWESPAYGAATRVVVDGCSDGWVYGRAGEPAPEPAAGLLASVAGGLLLRRSRRVH